MSQRRCWIRSHEVGRHVGSSILSAIAFISTRTLKAVRAGVRAFICVLPKTALAGAAPGQRF